MLREYHTRASIVPGRVRIASFWVWVMTAPAAMLLWVRSVWPGSVIPGKKSPDFRTVIRDASKWAGNELLSNLSSYDRVAQTDQHPFWVGLVVASACWLAAVASALARLDGVHRLIIQPINGERWRRKWCGLTTAPFFHTSKCTCTPVDRPVDPALAISSPERTREPAFRVSLELWA